MTVSHTKFAAVHLFQLIVIAFGSNLTVLTLLTALLDLLTLLTLLTALTLLNQLMLLTLLTMLYPTANSFSRVSIPLQRGVHSIIVTFSYHNRFSLTP
jgi:hypothetical protein